MGRGDRQGEVSATSFVNSHSLPTFQLVLRTAIRGGHTVPMLRDLTCLGRYKDVAAGAGQ